MANDFIGVLRLIAINQVCISKKNRHFGYAPILNVLFGGLSVLLRQAISKLPGNQLRKETNTIIKTPG